MKTYTFKDRTEWPTGPWDDEPEDKIEWEHNGFQCMMLRNDWGAWCGYVGLPEGHPWLTMPWYALESLAEVHGGITYGPAKCRPGEGPERICHSGPGDPLWIGFDCSHAWDIVPGRLRVGRQPPRGAAYRTLYYAKGQTEELAVQAGGATVKWNPDSETAQIGRVSMRVTPHTSLSGDTTWTWWVGVDGAWITQDADTREAAQDAAIKAAKAIEPIVDMGYLGRDKGPADPGDPEVNCVDGEGTGECLLCQAIESVCLHPWSEAKKALALLLRVPRA